ncbi:MAG: BON domain-containing protein [Pirellulales bacterium]|nr:BON domain-containing protein [Pirellulales bacterium]
MSAASAGTTRRDHDLEIRVQSALAASNIPALRRLVVEALDGTVTLRGRVCSFYEKQLSHTHCRHVPGVDRLVDAIDVIAASRNRTAVA